MPRTIIGYRYYCISPHTSHWSYNSHSLTIIRAEGKGKRDREIDRERERGVLGLRTFLCILEVGKLFQKPNFMSLCALGIF